MENQTTTKFKRWEDLDITDDFIFTRVMRNKRLCRTLLEMILKVKVGKIKFLTSHHAIQIDPNVKGIIMDVYLKDENKVINVEMQTSNHGDLPRRARYYQAAADIDTTPKGSQYSDLKQNYVIFICTFDPFDKNFPRYTFQYTCQETDHQLKLEDGSLRIFLNTATEELNNLDQKLQAFYHYIQKGEVESELTQNISRKITTLKNDSIVRRFYMTWSITMADMRHEGFEEGLEQGREQGAYQNKLETAKTMLSLGLPLDQIQLCTSLPLDVVQELAQTK